MRPSSGSRALVWRFQAEPDPKSRLSLCNVKASGAKTLDHALTNIDKASCDPFRLLLQRFEPATPHPSGITVPSKGL